MPLLDTNDIQANVVAPLPATKAIHLLLRLPPSAQAPRRGLAEWLDRVARQVTTAAQASQFALDHTVNIGLSARALRALGLDEEVAADLPVAYREGMRRRAHRVGDTGASAPEWWEDKLRDPDVVVTVAVLDEPRSRARRPPVDVRRSHRDVVAELWCDMKQLGSLRSQGARQHLIDGQRGEWFGWRDGITNPPVEGSGRAMRPGDGVVSRRGRRQVWRALKAGEFVHGYADENGTVTMSPAVHPYLRNGTFMVWRKLRQHVDEFAQYLERQAGSPEEAERLGERIVGRRKDGSALVPSDGPNGFVFSPAHDDECPATAHIRRANPRNAIDFADDIMPRHRIIRWGLPYGKAGRANRGLIFVCFNADIERQFEFIQGRWLNASRELRVWEATDTLAGTRRRSDGHDGSPPPFVTTLGGEYFLVPGINALRALASLPQGAT